MGRGLGEEVELNTKDGLAFIPRSSENFPSDVSCSLPGPGLLSVMVSFMYPLDRAMKCPGIWSNMTLGVSLRVLGMRLTCKSID